eukprot:SAG25_NODE_236_length_11287_cov_246.398999_4_plen_168_part_00
MCVMIEAPCCPLASHRQQRWCPRRLIKTMAMRSARRGRSAIPTTPPAARRRVTDTGGAPLHQRRDVRCVGGRLPLSLTPHLLISCHWGAVGGRRCQPPVERRHGGSIATPLALTCSSCSARRRSRTRKPRVWAAMVVAAACRLRSTSMRPHLARARRQFHGKNQRSD